LSTSGARSNSVDKRETRAFPAVLLDPRPSTLRYQPPCSPLVLSVISLPASLGTTGTHDFEYPSGYPTLLREADWEGEGGDNRPERGKEGIEGQTRTRVRSHRAARQTTDRRDDNIRDRGVKLCPGKRDNRSLRNCPSKSSSSSSSSSSLRRHDFTIRRRRARRSDASRNKSPSVARVCVPRFVDLHAKVPPTYSALTVALSPTLFFEKKRNKVKTK